ncbi:MAG: catalase, partial [Acidobacteriota bacterium]
MVPSTSWKENPPPGEDARFENYARRFQKLQQRNATSGALRRALHAKGHGIYEASLEISGDVPEHARHGLFAQPQRYEALVRFSSGAGKVQADTVGDVRGLAVKVLGVEGDKVLGDAPTQDLLAILSPATPFRTADEFVAVVWATRSPPLALFRLIGALGPVRPFQLVRKLLAGFKGPPRSLATRAFYSAVPIQCGPHAVRFAFTPRGEPEVELLPAGTDAFAEDVAARLGRGPVVYNLGLQFFVDEATTPIEDSSVDWPSPYVTVGTLTIAQQDAA